MLFWAIIVHFNRSVTVQCNVALDGLVNFHICIYIYILNMYVLKILTTSTVQPNPQYILTSSYAFRVCNKLFFFVDSVIIFHLLPNFL